MKNVEVIQKAARCDELGWLNRKTATDSFGTHLCIPNVLASNLFG